MEDRKLTTDELLQVSKKQFNVVHKFKDVSEDLDDFLYDFVKPRELKTIGKVLRRIKKHKQLKLEEDNNV